MCGIAGIAWFGSGRDPEPDRLGAMVATLRHRGPDDVGVEVRDGVGLGIRRLAVIDPVGGDQPRANEDGSVAVVLNGEIYNYRELRRELSSRGHRFASESDTEVLPHAYEEWGTAFVGRLEGMFAFALHDRRRRRVVLARDPMGIKPLYVSYDAERLLWGSEIKALLASGRVRRELDADGLAALLAWEYVPAPLTLFSAVRKLPPGSLVEIDLDAPRWAVQRYWRLGADDGDRRPRRPRAGSEAEWEERVAEGIERAVRSQLVSDVPVGCLLSGGVDSSLVAAHMGSGHTAYSLGFDDPTYDELPWARRVARHLGLPHVYETVRPRVADLFEDLLEQLDDPIGDFSIVPTYLLAGLAREGATVVLGGDGGDEIFGGYETYQAQLWGGLYRRVPGLLRRGVVEPWLRRLRPRPAKKGWVNRAKRFAEGMGHPDVLAHTRWRLFAGEEALDALLSPEVQARRTRGIEHHVVELFDEAAALPPVSRGLYVDLRSYLAENILAKVDRMTMAVSLEARVPLLDTALVRLAFDLPDRLKVTRRGTKPLLKRVAAARLPRDCVYRPKEGFSVPIKHWLRHDLRGWMEELLSRDRLEAEGVFQAGEVERLKAEHLAGAANHSHLLWTLVVAQAWRHRWLDAPPERGARP